MSSDDAPNRTMQSFPGRLDQLAAIGEFVGQCAQQADMDERDIFAIQTAVDEAATNIVLYAYGEELAGPIQVICWQEGNDFFVQLRDRGRPFDPSTVPAPDLDSPLEDRREGGLGIFLMRRMMDHVDFTREGPENVLTMVRHHAARRGLAAIAAILMPRGRIDAAASAGLARMLDQPLQAGQHSLVLDLSQVSYLSSSALRVLLVRAKELRRRGGRMLLCCAQPNVERVLRMTGLAEILSLYRTREAALNALESTGGPNPQ